MSPNQLEQQKLIINCMAHMEYSEEFDSGVDVMLENVINRQLESDYKDRLVKCLPSLCA